MTSPAAESSPTFRHLFLLALVSVLIFFVDLGGPKLWDRDEPRNSGCAREMQRSGDWIVPTFNAELRPHKPVLTYWLMAASYATFDDPEFAPRFPSAVLALLTVFMTYFISRRIFGDPSSAFWGALVLSTSVLFDLAARSATHDSVLTFSLTAMMLLFVRSAFVGESIRIPTLPAWIGIYVMMGLATLTKGPIPGFILPVAILGMFLLIATNDRAGFLNSLRPTHIIKTTWAMRPITLIIVVALVAAPWYLIVHAKTTGEFTEGFFLVHNLRRTTTAMEGHGVKQMWLYPLESILFAPLTFVGGLGLWSVLIGVMTVVSIRAIRGGESNRLGYIFLACWTILWAIAFSIPRTKLPHYLIPALPATALLTGRYLSRWIRSESPFPPRIVFGFLSVIGLALVGVSVVAIVSPQILIVLSGRSIVLFMPLLRWIGLIGLIPMIGAIIGYKQARRDNRFASAIALAVTCVATMFVIYIIFGHAASTYQESSKLLAAIRSASPESRVASFARLEPSWVYYLGQPIEEIPKEHEDRVGEFLRSGRDTFLITTYDRAERLRPRFPSDIVELARVPYFGHSDAEDLVVLGRSR